MSLFARNLNKYGKDIVIQSRTMGTLNGLPSEVFGDPIDSRGIIKTVTGITAFDSTNVETVITHRICIAYDVDVTAEKWILFKSKRIRIVSVENVCEMDEQMILLCTERGTNAKVVNEA